MAINEAIELRRIWQTYDKRKWFLIESHAATDEEQVFCREITDNGYLGHAMVIPRAYLRVTNKARVQISDRRLMETIHDGE